MGETRCWVIVLGLMCLMRDILRINEGWLKMHFLYKYNMINTFFVFILVLCSFTKPLTKKERQQINHRNLKFCFRFKL